MMEDASYGYIYEIASPLELGVAGHREPALIVWHHHQDADTAQAVLVLPPEELTEVLWRAGLLAASQPKENAA